MWCILILSTSSLSPTQYRRGSRIQKGGVQEFRLENRSYPDVHDFSLRMQVIIANANNIADSRRGGGGPSTQKQPLYPRLQYYLKIDRDQYGVRSDHNKHVKVFSLHSRLAATLAGLLFNKVSVFW